MDLVAGFDEVSAADLHVLVAANSKVVVGADFGFTICVGGAVFFGFEFAVATGLDGVVAFVPDADLLVVLDVFVPVALGVNVDLLCTFAVFDA